MTGICASPNWTAFFPIARLPRNDIVLIIKYYYVLLSHVGSSSFAFICSVRSWHSSARAVYIIFGPPSASPSRLLALEESIHSTFALLRRSFSCFF